MADYEALLWDLLDLVGAEPPPRGERDWVHRARWTAGKAVGRRAEEGDGVQDEWFDPLVRAMILEPDPSFSRQLVEPALAAFGRDRVQLALLTHLETGAPADAAGAARAWYWSNRQFRSSPFPTSPDLSRRYHHAALHRFVADEDLDVRRCILPRLPLHPGWYPAELHDLVAEAVRIARTSDDSYLRHRVEIQVTG
ncbi:hypothetical protein SAMN05216553_101464 [Lentzea fradiae]|uniref:Uncharacterized protein n=2 Tax=Lentzea fradiae TaxID=200378 RepID=A0A1G7KT05_9PSEU|nr:hypothetical protein SAMN05216553_101464 [Lentzea fradiae]